MNYENRPKDKLIINLCPTGMVPTKELNPYTPISVDEIVKTAVSCAKLGVSVVHIHPRDNYGKPTWRKDAFAKIIEGIRNNTDLIISVSTSGRNWSEFEKRSECLELEGDLKPELASLTVGSMNFINQESVNSPQMIELLAKKMMDRGIKPEFEIFEPGMLHKAKFLLQKEIVKDEKPYFNLLFGSLGTAPFEPMVFATLLSMLPTNSVWSAAGIGQYQLYANAAAIIFGGHIRIGLEDNLYYSYDAKEPATNDVLVERIVGIANKLGRGIATPKEAREILGL
ncbi:MAG: hypothetical protein A2W23_01955 [Planctomycetes bacterium RBG_16_43_13]|nr:MAG: hypothetical protein A2W23_01955 [Planctomycetes bacterium RBG_16_43_13]